MISNTVRPETRAAGRQRGWARGASRLAGVLAFLAILGLLGLILATAIAPRLWGYHTYVIYGSSMEPTIKAGSLVISKPANVDDLQVNDIMVFRSPGNGTTVTHRIVGIRHEDGQHYFQTKGDASNGGDPNEVALGGDVQRLAFHLPYVGYFVDFANSTLGITLLILLPAAGLLVLSWSNRRRPQGDADGKVAEAPPEG